MLQVQALILGGVLDSTSTLANIAGQWSLARGPIHLTLYNQEHLAKVPEHTHCWRVEAFMLSHFNGMRHSVDDVAGRRAIAEDLTSSQTFAKYQKKDEKADKDCTASRDFTVAEQNNYTPSFH